MFDRQFAPTRAAASDSALLLSRVSALTLLMVLLTAAGCGLFLVLAVATGAVQPLFWGSLIGVFVMLFVCRAVEDRFPLNIACLSLFALLEGMLISPLLLRYAAQDGVMVIVQAGALATLIFGAVAALGYTSARSFAHWMPWLIGGLFVLLIGGLIMWFVTASDGIYWLYSVGGVVLFTAFVFVDFTRIRQDFHSGQYVQATMAVYLDLINLFLFLLRLLGSRR